ncbi:hypothetical protein B0H14DRAFT_3632042 [Mycena olivaceomarginata]|nr:hypothetical protein B0H14DRAFT_3632042 [Mycena olivaceomarginata]
MPQLDDDPRRTRHSNSRTSSASSALAADALQARPGLMPHPHLHPSTRRGRIDFLPGRGGHGVQASSRSRIQRYKHKHKRRTLAAGWEVNEGISVLRMVTLNDFDRLQREGRRGRTRGAWRVHENVCVFCAGPSMGLSACRGNSLGSYSVAGGEGVGRRKAAGPRTASTHVHERVDVPHDGAVLMNLVRSALFLNSVRVELSGRLGGMGSPPRVPHGGDEREKRLLPVHVAPIISSMLPSSLDPGENSSAQNLEVKRARLTSAARSWTLRTI